MMVIVLKSYSTGLTMGVVVVSAVTAEEEALRASKSKTR